MLFFCVGEILAYALAHVYIIYMHGIINSFIHEQMKARTGKRKLKIAERK